jgi:hypothetical protein
LAKAELGRHPELLEAYPKPDPDSVLAYLTAKFVKRFPKLPDMVPFQGKLKVSW